MKNSDSREEIRIKALTASQEATHLLQEAFDLMLQGRTSEAQALKRLAEEKQTEARRLVEQARQLARE